MKKAMIVMAIFLVALVSFIWQNYHRTVQGALEELAEETEGYILPLSDSTLALIMEEDGHVSVATSKIIYPFGWYKDFVIHPIDLNINDVKKENEIAYAHVPKTEDVTCGLIKNEHVAYVVANESYLQTPKELNDNAMKVFSLKDYFDDPQLQDMKLWYSYLLGEGSTMDELFFLDSQKKVIPIEEK
ncbi:hypothetical protein CD798_15335 [Bacillaceae bacterium SAOS 7]|nr:hypothetical protein CD798_15335 [Bacillaceae bacterium SAOS 7]